MITELRITALNENGTKALQQMIGEDAVESMSRKSKVNGMFTFDVPITQPLTYSAKITEEHIKVLISQARRMGQFFKIDKEVLVDTFMGTVKSGAINSMQKNDAILKTKDSDGDYKIRLIDDSESD